MSQSKAVPSKAVELLCFFHLDVIRSINRNICAHLDMLHKNAVKSIYCQSIGRCFDWFPISRCTFRFVFEIISKFLDMVFIGMFLFKNIQFVLCQHYSKRKCWTPTWILLSLRYMFYHMFASFDNKIWYEKEKNTLQISDFIWISFSDLD